MTLSTAEVWVVIGVLAVGTFLIRFSFLGLIGDRPLPVWVLRMLRYTPVALLPGIIAPLVLSPPATDGVFDPARGLAAFVTIAIGLITRSFMAAIGGGAATLYASLWLFG